MGLGGDDIPSNIKLMYETLWENEHDHRTSKKGPFLMGDFSYQEGKFQTNSLGKRFSFGTLLRRKDLEPQLGASKLSAYC